MKNKFLISAIAILLFAQNTSAQVKIGTQTWATKNLDVSTFRNGDVIPEVKTIEEWKASAEAGKPAWCYYNNDSENGKKYGKLYNWYAVNDLRGLAPKGWHVPNNAEWKALSANLGGKDVAGKKMKASNGWEKNGNGTDSIGFAALPGGSRGYDGSWGQNIGSGAFWWSASERETDGWYQNVSFAFDNTNMNSVDKGNGSSVRCIKD